jgi:hypothetical protein
MVATREPSEEFARLPELNVRGLRDGDARELLASVIRGPLDAQVRERIVAETRGNPLALLELPRSLTPAELAGGFGVLDVSELSGRIEDGFRRRIEELPPDTQRLLLIAAAEPIGEPMLLWRAAERLGVATEASSIAPYGAVTLAVLQGREAESSELIDVATKDVEGRGEGEGLTFVHWAKAVLCNSLCRYDEALAAAQQASDDSPALWFSTWGLVELIEATARSGVPEHAHGALQRLSETTLASGTDWALGVEARSRALLSDGEVAESLTGRLWSTSLVLRCASNWGAVCWSMASGCAANGAAGTAAISFAVRTRSSIRLARMPSPSGREWSCVRPAGMRASAQSIRLSCFPPKRGSSHAWPVAVRRIRR